MQSSPGNRSAWPISYDTYIEGEVPIDKEASNGFRANTMRAQFLSSDRTDVQFESRDLARKMQQPSNLDEMG